MDLLYTIISIQIPVESNENPEVQLKHVEELKH